MKFSLSFFFSFFAFLTFVSCQNSSTKESGVDLLPPAAFIEAYQAEESAVLIDCRTPGEISRGKVEGAINIDYTSPNFTDQAEKLDKSKPVYVYCQVGGRSASAAKKLKTLGFKEVHDMKGGFRAYSKK